MSEMKAIDPANVFQDRTLAPFTTKKGRTCDEVVKRMKAGAKEELEKLERMTEQGTSISMSIGGKFDLAPISSCTIDFPNQIKWVNPYFVPPQENTTKFVWTYPWDGLRTGSPVEPTKDDKLSYIKGLIEGARLIASVTETEHGLLDTDSLLDKILEVIEK